MGKWHERRWVPHRWAPDGNVVTFAHAPDPIWLMGAVKNLRNMVKAESEAALDLMKQVGLPLPNSARVSAFKLPANKAE